MSGTADVPAEDLDLVALICSRLCHDLAGSIGAINNGIELLAEETDPAMRDEAIGLIAMSGGDAARRLAFFRQALGASGSLDEPLALPELARVAEAYFAGGKITAILPDEPAGSLPKPLGKAVLLLLLLAAQALVRGGTLTLARDTAKNGWRITGQGSSLRWSETAAAGLGDGDWPREPQAALARYARKLAAMAGCRIAVRTGDDTVTISVAP
ncbi:histidine phosphotransferase family protein [Ferrovibrio xuzhouensis]|uniref:Histidine phosphotransferase family protein n=1 Tax=Ferrovibrio xuzhouensis TaxID=1576914 RepID=A0ABV7VE95_9PROT